MALIATVRIRNKRNGKICKVNQEDYANDLGTSRYSGWELVSEQHNDDAAAKVVVTDAPTPGIEVEDEPAAKLPPVDTKAKEKAAADKLKKAAAAENAEAEATEKEDNLFGDNVARGKKLGR